MIDWTTFRVRLCHLSALTDDHAREVAGLWVGEESQPEIVERYVAEHSQNFYIKIREGGTILALWSDGEISVEGPSDLLPYARITDRLRALGYDLPADSLGGLTLKEAGLAVYE